MTRDDRQGSRMAAALGAIAAYLEAERVEQPAVREDRWAVAGRLDAQRGSRMQDEVQTGWGRRGVR